MNIIDRKRKIPEGARWLCVADLHLHHLPAWRLDWCYEFADDLIAYIDETKLELMILGDVLEVKDKVDSRVSNILLYIVANCTSDVYWLTGQHDSYKPGQATFYELGSLAHVHVIDENVLKLRGGKVFLVPFSRDRERYREQLAGVPDGASVFTHIPIAEALRGFGAELPDDAICVKDFKRFEWVYSGDIHKHAKFKNFEYIGAVSQRDWRDEGVAGCVGIVTKDGTLTRISVAHPIHRRIKKKTDLKTQSKVPEILKVDGIDLSDEQLVELRGRKNVVEAEWVPPPVEILVKKSGGENAGERDPKKLIAEYLDNVTLPEGHATKKELREYAVGEVLEAIGHVDTD